MNIFISYPDRDLTLAEVAQLTFEKAGHTVWMFNRDRTPGELTQREIARCIVNADAVLVVCTAATSEAEGQAREIGIALNNSKWMVVVVIDDAVLPPELSGVNYSERVKAKAFGGHCDRLAVELPEVQERIRGAQSESPDTPSAVSRDRAKYMADLNARTEDMNAERVTTCRRAMLGSYLETAVPRQVSAVRQVFDGSETGFGRVTMSARRRLEEFNAENTYWDLFCSEMGRGVALGEESHFFKSLVERVPTTDVTIAARNPDFDVLVKAIEELKGRGHAPNVVLVPVELMSSFTMRYLDQLDWSSRPGEKLTLPGIEVRVLTSSNIAPLDRFIIFNTSNSLWSVKPDPVTGNALWVALGRSALYPDEVEWIAETVVKHELKQPEATCAIPVEGELKINTAK